MNRLAIMNEPVALLSMVQSKLEVRHAMINAIEQTYRPLVQYLIYQNEWETPIQPYESIEIKAGCVQVDEMIRGDFWHKKMRWFLDNVTEKITCIFDADDRYESRYIERCTDALGLLDGVWNFDQMFACNDGLKMGKVQSGYGTLCIKTEVLRVVYDDIANKTDCDLRKALASRRIGLHSGLRYYFLHNRQHSLPHPITQREMIKELDKPFSL